MNGSEIMAARRENERQHHIATLQQLMPDLDAAAVMAAESEVFRRLVAELVRIRDEQEPMRAVAERACEWNDAYLLLRNTDPRWYDINQALHKAAVTYHNAWHMGPYRRTQEVHDDEAEAQAVRAERHARWVAARRNGGTAV